MRLIWLVVGLLWLALGPVGAEENTPAEDAFFAQGLRPAFAQTLTAYPDIPRYTYELQLDPTFEQVTLSGPARIRYTNTTPDALGEIVLRLYANLATFGGEAILQNTAVDGAPLAHSLDETRTVAGFPLPEPLLPGESVTLTFDYQLTVLQGRERLYNQLSYLETEIAMASALPLLSVYEPGRGWWRGSQHAQGDAVYSDIAHFDVTLTAPAYLSVITSGTLVEESAEGDWLRMRFAAPLMRDFALMASGAYERLAGTYEDVNVEVFYLPGQRAGAEDALAWTIDSLAAFSGGFGPYPYAELDVVETYTAASGIEYPGLIVLANSIWRPGSRWFEWVTVHEVAHQWWYALVGNHQVDFPWLDEALTEWSVAYYAEATGGTYQEYIDIFRQEYQQWESERGALVIGQPALAYETAAYSPVVYRKGATFFDVLRQTLGDGAFFAALRTYFERYQYAIATPFDLQTVLEEQHGAELDALFFEWVGYSN